MRLLGGLRPIRRRGSEEMGFEFVSSFPKRLLVSLDFGEQAAGFGCLLSRHAAVSVEIDWRLGHASTFVGALLKFQWKIASKAEVSAASCERRDTPESTK